MGETKTPKTEKCEETLWLNCLYKLKADDDFQFVKELVTTLIFVSVTSCILDRSTHSVAPRYYTKLQTKLENYSFGVGVVILLIHFNNYYNKKYNIIYSFLLLFDVASN